MSDVVEKTLASLPKILSESLLGGPPSPRKTSSHGFQVFVRLVNRARSKQEEEHVIKQELTLIQQQLSQADVKQTQSLTSLVKVRPESALDYQMIVVELLDDPHYLIQKKTLELLFNMANPVNVQVVIGCVSCKSSQAKGDNPLEFKQHLIKKCEECLFIKDSSPELVQISTWMDFTLSFLDDFVVNSLENGCPPYKPCYLRKDTTSELIDKKSIFSGLTPTDNKTLSEDSSAQSQEIADGGGESISSSGISDSTQNVQWAKEGFLGEEKEDVTFKVETQQKQISPEKIQEIEKKKELASALFGGISSQESKLKNEENVINSVNEIGSEKSGKNFANIFEEDIQIRHKSDSGGWRKFHTERKDLGPNDTELSPFDHSSSSEVADGTQTLNLMSNQKPQTSNIGQFESGAQNLYFSQNHEIPFSQDRSSAIGSQNSNIFSNQQIHDSRDSGLGIGTENLNFLSNTDSSTAENIDFMKYSELKSSSSEQDYFNPVTGNWELELNTDVNAPLSLDSLAILGTSKPSLSSDHLLIGQDKQSNILLDNPPDE
ncbi:hypothetical protein KUTeg_010958 [Tegillarca granosa]|uniref:Uncharacterized protein n=1 Tax=Tegillarca granosa TaxID=220873 RepID=A0ABQ9F2H8_TEGGR|nr:hypothetical protein KUTeg_010958 [Tegillarca granosa]